MLPNVSLLGENEGKRGRKVDLVSEHGNPSSNEVDERYNFHARKVAYGYKQNSLLLEPVSSSVVSHSSNSDETLNLR